MTGDVDGDGLPDFAVADDDGFTVYAGPTGAPIYSVPMPSNANFIGALASGRDLDHDGVNDVVIGDPSAVVHLENRGAVWVYSGATGSLLFEADGPRKDAFFGWSAAFVGDFFVFQNAGGERIDASDSRSDGQPIYHYFDVACRQYGFGSFVSRMGDLDDDDEPEALFTSYFEDDGSGTSPGAVDVWRMDDLYVDATPRDAIGGDVVSLTVGQRHANAPYALFVTDVNGAPTFSLLAVGALNASGRATFTDTAPTSLSGDRFGFRGFALDPSGTLIASGTETIAFQ